MVTLPFFFVAFLVSNAVLLPMILTALGIDPSQTQPPLSWASVALSAASLLLSVLFTAIGVGFLSLLKAPYALHARTASEYARQVATISAEHARQVTDISAERDGFKDRLVTAQQLEQRLLALGVAREEGVRVRNAQLSLDQLADWMEAVGRWEAATLERVREFSVVEAIPFETLDHFDRDQFPGVLNDEHWRRRSMLSRRLDLLQEIINRFSLRVVEQMLIGLAGD